MSSSGPALTRAKRRKAEYLQLSLHKWAQYVLIGVHERPYQPDLFCLGSGKDFFAGQGFRLNLYLTRRKTMMV